VISGLNVTSGFRGEPGLPGLKGESGDSGNQLVLKPGIIGESGDQGTVVGNHFMLGGAFQNFSVVCRFPRGQRSLR
jgi:hypothetical protein